MSFKLSSVVFSQLGTTGTVTVSIDTEPIMKGIARAVSGVRIALSCGILAARHCRALRNSKYATILIRIELDGEHTIVAKKTRLLSVLARAYVHYICT